MPTDRARRLNEALHDVFSNEQRWEIIDRFLKEEREEAVREGLLKEDPLYRQNQIGRWF